MTFLLHRRMDEAPARAVGGEGVWLIDADGRRVLDGSGGAAVACLGHGDRRVGEAIRRQLDAVAYAHTSFFTTDAAEELAAELVGDAPGGLTHAFLVSSGSEAMESALKLARQYFLELGQPARERFIARRMSYHGNTLGALGASGNVPRRAPYLPLLSGAFSHVSPCFAYRYRESGETDAAYVARLGAELEAEFQRLGPNTVAAFCAETVVGATAGCVTPLPGYFAAMRAVCNRHGALLILDEVMCGMGRCGTRHAWEAEGVTPDIMALAKGLAGGYQPIGALLIAARVVDAIRAGSGAFVHGHTYQAHPVASAAALAVQRVIREDGLVENVRAMGEVLSDGLHDRLGNHAHVGDIRGRGLFMAIELVAERGTRAPFEPARKMHQRGWRSEAYARGLAIYPMGGTVDGMEGDHIVIAPPYIVSAAEIGTLVARLGDAVDAAIRA